MSDYKKPLISVITVSFNSVKYIEQCIRSVIEQSYDDFEYVIIDGGSSDGTKEIIEKYTNHLTYWHSKPDRGLAHAFNEAVKYSKGHWLLFLNSDDYFIDSDVLNKISNFLNKYSNYDVIFGQVVVVSREDNPVKIGGPYGHAFKWRKFIFHDTIPHQAAFTKRDFIEFAGPFNEDFKIAVDYEHYLRKGSSLRAINVPVLMSCMRDGGLSQENLLKTLQDLHKARKENKILPFVFLNLIHYWVLSRFYLGRHLKNIFRKIKR